jgi:hypothetical protein
MIFSDGLPSADSFALSPMSSAIGWGHNDMANDSDLESVNLVRKVCVFLKKIDPEGKGIDQTETILPIFCRQKIGL